MGDDNHRPPWTGKCRHRRSFGAGLALVGLLVTVALLAAACGGGSKDPGAPSGSGTTTTVAPGGKTGAPASSGSSTTQTELLQLAQCMRSHGVPTFPDPSATEGTLGAMVSSAGIDLQSPTVQAALEGCQQYTPTQNVTPAQSAAQNAQQLQFAQCMRSHGVPNFPDPSASTGTGTGAVHLNLGGTGIDMSSPTVQAAITACGGLKQ
jgi:acyl-CoA synthetase (NDP forming)